MNPPTLAQLATPGDATTGSTLLRDLGAVWDGACGLVLAGTFLAAACALSWLIVWIITPKKHR